MSIEKHVTKDGTLELRITTIERDVKDIAEDLDKIDLKYVRVEIFDLRVRQLERLVYGATGMVLVAFMGALVALILR